MLTLTFRPRPAGSWGTLLLGLGLLAGCQSGSTSQGERATAADSSAAPATLTANRTAAAPPYIRRNAASPEARADLVALDSALSRMRRLPCTDRRSWYYQGAIHNVPGSIGKAPDFANPLCDAYTTGKALLWGWDGCTHQAGHAAKFNAHYHFLIWHRLYVQHFEAIVRELSGKADFALPYWDYLDPRYYQMPAIFRQQRDALYEAARYAPLNQGQPIDTTAGHGLPPKSLNKPFIFQYTNYDDFNSNLEGVPHGVMHDYIGCGGNDTATSWNSIYQQRHVGGLMGNVPSAAFDPIFWAHHANIDYLWASWARTPQGQGQAPSLASMQKTPWPYRFVTSTGDTVSYTMAQAWTKAMNPDYRYDALPETATLLAADRPAGLKASPAQEKDPVTLASVSVGKTLASGRFTARLPVPARQQPLLRSATPKTAAAAAGGQPTPRLLLEVTASVSKEPRSSYALYVHGAGGRAALTAPGQLAGILNFFGLDHSMPGMRMAMPGEKLSRTFVFDVTDELSAAAFDGQLDVQLVPSSPSAPPITIDKLTLLTRPAR